MSSHKLFLLVFTLLVTSIATFAQDAKDGLTFECKKWEERQNQACGPSPFDLSKRFQIGGLSTADMGWITITNTGNRHVELELVELTPGYDKNDAGQRYWFIDVSKRMSAKRGEKIRIKPTFVGRQRSTGSHSKTLWVDEGAYDGSMKLRNKANGAIYEFKFTVHAYKPGKK